MHAKNVVGTSVGVVVVTDIGAIVWASVATGTAQRGSGSTVPQVPKGVAATAPGTDPKIQQWFVRIEQARVAFDNVLLKAENDINTGAATGNCSLLLTVTSLLKNHLPALNAIAGGPAHTWGLSKTISKPVVGNHEYGTSGAGGYFGYFGSLAGSAGLGYYSYSCLLYTSPSP